MAIIKKPSKDSKPAIQMTAVQPPDTGKKASPLQLPVGATNKADYKAYAVKKGKTMPELFLEMFEFYKQHHD
jgi:cell envelope opacity-associated protein A|tara:strand:+ start:2248 stop:2463 length:216 start_codon:yes stop_codon:yes gene_type:complete